MSLFKVLNDMTQCMHIFNYNNQILIIIRTLFILFEILVSHKRACGFVSGTKWDRNIVWFGPADSLCLILQINKKTDCRKEKQRRGGLVRGDGVVGEGSRKVGSALQNGRP